MKGIAFLLAWIGIFLLSLLGIFYSLSQEAFYNLNLGQPGYRWWILGISVIYLLIVILKLWSKFPERKDFEIDSEHGKIIISSESIKGVVKDIVGHEEGVHLLGVKTIKKFRSFNIELEVESGLSTDFYNNFIEINKKIKEEVKKSLNVEINNISLKLLKIVKK